MKSFIIQYNRCFLEVVFNEVRTDNKIIYQGDAFILETMHDKSSTENHTLSFTFTFDGIDLETETQAVIESSFKGVIKNSKKLGTNILSGIANYIGLLN